MSTKTEGFAHMLLIIGVVIVGIIFLGYFAYKNGQIKPSQSQEQIPTIAPKENAEVSGWKTYIDDHYRIKYPSNWPRPEESLLSTSTVVNFDDQLSIWSGARYSQELQRNYTMDEFVNAMHKNNSEAIIQKIEISRQSATRVETPTGSSAREVNIYIPDSDSDDGYLSITYQTTDAKAELFQEIISTFKLSPFSLEGKIHRIESPPTANYNFELHLTEPYFDTLNAQGPRYISTIIVVPKNDSIKQEIEANLSKTLVVEGEIEWGLAETRHLRADKVYMPGNF